jgi:enoyl-CoA hydratase/carnithine racemase
VPNLTIDEKVAVLELGDDENRVTRETMKELAVALDEVVALAEPHALLTIGQGKFFSNGLASPSTADRPEDRSELRHEWETVLAKILTLPVPTVAAVNGHAFGAGALLALAHDHRLMRADRGFFCLPEIDLGHPFSPGLTALLMSKLTARAATTLILTARRLTGPEAEQLDVVDELATPDELRDKAFRLAAELAGKDQAALGAAKQAMYGHATRLLAS